MDIKNVLIDAISYRIEKTNEVIISNGQQCAACVDFNIGVIRIDDAISKSGAAAQVLMHEIVHALLTSRGMNEASDDEALVDALASGIINLLRVNPALIKFITEIDDNGGISVCKYSNNRD